MLERYLPDGRRDPGFGAGGRVQAASPFGGAVAEAGAVAADPAGGALLGGQASDVVGRISAVLWKVDDGGRLDARFGRGGVARLAQPGESREARVSALFRLPDGSWLAAGTLDWKRLALWRVWPDGTAAADFGSGGLALADGVGRGLASDGAGGVWAAGFSYLFEKGRAIAAGERAVLSHFAAPGGGGGKTVLLEASGHKDREAFAIARAPSGGLFLAGYADAGRPPIRACVWALTPQGREDRRFGRLFNRRGVLILPNASDGGEDRLYALALDASGRLLAAGFSKDAKGRRRLAVWRIAP